MSGGAGVEPARPFLQPETIITQWRREVKALMTARRMDVVMKLTIPESSHTGMQTVTA
jgi:hypothetical protein